MFTLGDFMDAPELPYDSPPQVIYRIDDHRFVSLEHYRDCHHGETFYNDTKAGIHYSLGRASVENYQGRIVNADPTGRNIVIPGGDAPHIACSDRGCGIGLLYSTDGGKTFWGNPFNEYSFNPFEDSKRYTILVTEDSYYVVEKQQYKTYVEKDPLIPGYVYGRGPLPSGRKVEYGVPIPSDLHSPSGQERLSCDVSIKPTNPDAPLK